MVTLLGPAYLRAQSTANWFGVWKLNLARSSYSSGTPPYKRAMRRIEPSARGVKIIDDLVRPRGGVLHLEWIGKFDGLDYPIQGVEVVLSNAYRCSDDRTCELVQKLDGAVVLTARLTISPDGRLLTAVAAGSTTVYERQ
jgi:hypothetical protein